MDRHLRPSGYALSISISQHRVLEPRRQGRALLAVINPTKDFSFTPVEGKAVMALFSDARSLEEHAATVQVVLDVAPRCQYVHFTCHGRYAWQDPM